MSEFEIEPMTCGYCGIEVTGCIWEFALNHNCEGQKDRRSPEYQRALKRRVEKEKGREE